VTRDDHVVGQMDWDEDLDSLKQTSQKKEAPLAAPSKPVVPGSLTAREDMPLLSKKASKVSFSNVLHPNHTHVQDTGSHSLQVPSYHATPEVPIRRMSSTSVPSSKNICYNFSGQSTYGQTVCFLLFY